MQLVCLKLMFITILSTSRKYAITDDRVFSSYSFVSTLLTYAISNFADCSLSCSTIQDSCPQIILLSLVDKGFYFFC